MNYIYEEEWTGEKPHKRACFQDKLQNFCYYSSCCEYKYSITDTFSVGL